MKVELLQNTAVPLSAGDRFEATPKGDGMVTLHVETQFTVPASWVRERTIEVLGVSLVVGTVYDLVVTQRWGTKRRSPRNLNRWEYLGFGDHPYRDGKRLRFGHRTPGHRWATARREIDDVDIVSIKEHNE